MKLRLLLVALMVCGAAAWGADLRIGIIGCDTSHVVAFTETLNNPEAKGHVAGGKVVAAYKGGSADIPSSIKNIEGYSKTLREKYGVKFYDSIEEMCKDVDVVLLESVDGRPHLEQVKPVLRAGKPVFIDKPMAASLKDVVEIFRLAKEAKVPVFSSSSLRFAKDTQAVHNGSIGKVSYAETYGPCEPEPHHPDLFWYGVHGVESLLYDHGNRLRDGPAADHAGRQDRSDRHLERRAQGVYREDKGYHGLAKGEKGEATAGSFDGYQPLVVAIMTFFQTGVAPVPPEETIEIMAFMEAADESKNQGGAPVKIRVK